MLCSLPNGGLKPIRVRCVAPSLTHEIVFFNEFPKTKNYLWLDFNSLM